MTLRQVSAAAILAASSAAVFAQQAYYRQGNGAGAGFAARAGAAAPAVAVSDIPYTNNVVENAGFEKGLDKDPRKGWMEREGEGAEVKIVSAPQGAPASELPPDGKKALKLAVKKPRKFSNKQLNGDYAAFVAVQPVAAGVTQIVKVKPGAKYALRYSWRGVDFYPTVTAAGPGRGQMNATVAIVWLDSTMRPIPKDKLEAAAYAFESNLAKATAAAMKDGSDGWKTFAYPAIPTPEEVVAKKKKIPSFPAAPKGAAFARIAIGLSSKSPTAKPELWIDKFEFSEVPPVPVPLPEAPAAAPAPAAK